MFTCLICKYSSNHSNINIAQVKNKGVRTGVIIGRKPGEIHCGLDWRIIIVFLLLYFKDF